VNYSTFFFHSPTPTHSNNYINIPLTMFDFEKLDIYKKAKAFNAKIRTCITSSNLDRTTKDQLRRASFSIVLNIAEGSGRFSKADRRNFFIIARSSIFECVAILDVLKDEDILDTTNQSINTLHPPHFHQCKFRYTLPAQHIRFCSAHPH